MNHSYAIVGSGALGGLYGGMLANAGAEVHFLLHSDYDHVRTHGLKVESQWGDFDLPRVNAYNDPRAMPPCDVTIVAIKTTLNDKLSELLPGPTRGGGNVLVLQNGLGIEADSIAVVGEDRVLSGCCFLCSNKVGPGHIRHLDNGRIAFGEGRQFGQITPRVRSILADFRSAGIEIEAEPNMGIVRWKKLLWNIPFNSLSVILDASTEEMMRCEATVELARSIITEVHDAAGRCGFPIKSKAIETTIEVTKKMVPYDSSMRLDYLAGRPLEIDAILKAPIAAARQAGSSMPRTEVLAHQLAFLAARRCGPGIAPASASREHAPRSADRST